MRLVLFIYIIVCSYSIVGGASENIVNLDVNIRCDTYEIKVNPEEQEYNNVTSSGLPAADLREAKGEVNRRASTVSGKTSGVTEDEIAFTPKFDGKFEAGMDSNEWKRMVKEISKLNVESRIIRVMSYNVQAVHKVVMPNVNIYARMHTLLNYTRELIVERGVDVIVFQEVFLYEFYTKLVEELNLILPYNTGVIGEVGEIYQWNSYVNERSWFDYSFMNGGVCIFSKYPIVEKHQLIFKDYTGTCGFLRKGAVLAVIKKNGLNFNIIGTHLQAFDEVRHQNIRRLQMNELSQWVINLYKGRIKSSQPYRVSKNNPLIIAGDLNTCIVNDTEDFNSIVLSNVYLELFDTFNNTLPIPTYDTFENDYCNIQNEQEYNHIYDYILMSNKLKVIEPQTTIIKKLDKPITINKYGLYIVIGQVDVYNASDHYPVFTTLKIKQ